MCFEIIYYRAFFSHKILYWRETDRQFLQNNLFIFMHVLGIQLHIICLLLFANEVNLGFYHKWHCLERYKLCDKSRRKKIHLMFCTQTHSIFSSKYQTYGNICCFPYHFSYSLAWHGCNIALLHQHTYIHTYISKIQL